MLGQTMPATPRATESEKYRICSTFPQETVVRLSAEKSHEAGALRSIVKVWLSQFDRNHEIGFCLVLAANSNQNDANPPKFFMPR